MLQQTNYTLPMKHYNTSLTLPDKLSFIRIQGGIQYVGVLKMLHTIDLLVNVLIWTESRRFRTQMFTAVCSQVAFSIFE